MRLTTFIRGVSIGFILGVLFAPDKGSSTRRKISGLCSDIRDDMASTFDDISDMVSEKIRDVRNMAENITSNGKNEFDDLTLDEERI